MATTVLLLIGTSAKSIGGVEIWARETALQLSERGVSSVVAFNGEPIASVREYLNIPGLTLVSLPQLSANTWTKWGRIRGLLKTYRPQIVHWQFLDAVSSFPWLSRFHGVKQVFFTNQASYPEAFIPRRTPLWKRTVVRGINQPLTAMFCISDYIRQVVVACGYLQEDRAHRIHNAVALPCLKDTASRSAMFRRDFGIPEHAPIIAQVSWLIPEKGLEDLLHAAKIVLVQHPEARFVVAGNGKDRDKLVGLASALGISQSIVFAGFLESPNSCGLYDAADVVCQLSRWEEGFGYVIAEGMSFSKPIVATRVGGIPEVVADGETGYLSAKRDPSAAAANICKLLENPSLRRRLGEAARRRVEERFLVGDRVREMLQHYDIPARRSPGC